MNAPGMIVAHERIEEVPAMKAFWFWFLLTGLLASAPAHAEHREKVCATYVNSGANYLVTATMTNGSELNQATRSYNYNMYSNYVVIFWDQHEASVIDMGVLQPVYLLGAYGTDQEGRQWRITNQNLMFCQ